MPLKYKIPQYATAVLVFLLGCMSGMPRADETRNKEEVPTIEDAVIFNEAYGWVKKAEALMGTPGENSDEQAELYLKATQIKPDFLEAHYNLGLIYSNQNKIEEAARAFEKVMEIEPEFEGIYQLLASAYGKLGSMEAAIKTLQ